MTPEQPSTYKHQLTEEDFRFSFTATEAEFAERAGEMREKGVERLTGAEIRRKYGVSTGWETDEDVFTLVADAKIITKSNNEITFRGIPAPVPNLLLWRSQMPAFTLMACVLARSENDQIEQDATSFHFIESTTDNFTIAHSMTGNFTIERSTTEHFSIEQSTIGYFAIRRHSTTEDFIITQSTTGSFIIREKSTTGNFDILDQSTMGNFAIRGQSTMGNFTTRRQSTTGNFAIRGQSTAGDFTIEQSMTGNFTIEQSTTGSFIIHDSEVAAFDGDGLFSSFNLTKATIAQFRLQNCHLPQLRIASGCRIECYVAHSTINLIDLQHLTLSKESAVSLFNCSVYICLMEEFAVLGSLFFRQIKKADEPFIWYDPAAKGEGDTHRLIVLQQHAQSYEQHKMRLTNALSINQPTFRIAQSSLGKTEFANCDLRGFRFEFNNAKITEVFMSGGTVPEKNIVVYNCTENDDPLTWHEQKVSVYNQLKKIFDGQGDVYWATHFQAKTAEHQQRVLQLRLQTEDERFSTTFWDLWTFRLNQWSNLHGESWGRALLFTLGVAALFYMLFLLSVGRLFQPTAFDWNLVGQYFQFLDPTHKVDFVKDATLNVGSYVADYTGRVFIGYGIYQLISAFRKHARK